MEKMVLYKMNQIYAVFFHIHIVFSWRLEAHSLTVFCAMWFYTKIGPIVNYVDGISLVLVLFSSFYWKLQLRKHSIKKIVLLTNIIMKCHNMYQLWHLLYIFFKFPNTTFKSRILHQNVNDKGLSKSLIGLPERCWIAKIRDACNSGLHFFRPPLFVLRRNVTKMTWK